MSASKDSRSGSGTPPDGPGVLANLPRTRPQRSSPRRAAARKATAIAGATETSARSTPRPAKRLANTSGSATRKARADRGEDADTGATRPTKAARSSTRARRPRSASGRGRDRFVKEEAVPKQGFECDGERANGPVQPPGGAELLASAGEIFSEVAKAGFSTGERVVRDLLSRLPIS